MSMQEMALEWMVYPHSIVFARAPMALAEIRKLRFPTGIDSNQ